MSDRILPEVNTLTTDDTNSLDATYTASRSGAYAGVAEVLVAGLALTGTLGWLQLFLRRRTNRTLNPGLAAATLIVALTAGELLVSEAGQLRVAKVDESRFLTESQRIAYDAAFAKEISVYQHNNSDVPFGGYLGDEFRNITFPGERAAATRTLLAYQVEDQLVEGDRVRYRDGARTAGLGL